MHRMGPPITGEPYSGDLESEHTQTLGDGTHIDQKREVSRTYRDSQGRTRTERLLVHSLVQKAQTEQGPRLIRIYDPVEGYSYTLDTQKHVAHRVAVQSLPEAPPAKVPRGTDSSNGQPVLPTLGGRLAAGTNGPHRPDMKRESLGTEMIDGIEAEGWRTTITTPVGAMGNDKPIVHVCETWHATELKTLLLSKCTDPRLGHSTMRLKNLDLSEPDPNLFQVPSDYTIVDEKGRFTVSLNDR
jgi:hypothetical protein